MFGSPAAIRAEVSNQNRMDQMASTLRAAPPSALNALHGVTQIQPSLSPPYRDLAKQTFKTLRTVACVSAIATLFFTLLAPSWPMLLTAGTLCLLLREFHLFSTNYLETLENPAIEESALQSPEAFTMQIAKRSLLLKPLLSFFFAETLRLDYIHTFR